MNNLKLLADAGDQFLAALAENQETFLKSIATLAAYRPPTTPAPFAVALPTAQDVTEANFAFAQKLLQQQKQFADKLFAAPLPAIS